MLPGKPKDPEFMENPSRPKSELVVLDGDAAPQDDVVFRSGVSLVRVDAEVVRAASRVYGQNGTPSRIAAAMVTAKVSGIVNAPNPGGGT